MGNSRRASPSTRRVAPTGRPWSSGRSRASRTARKRLARSRRVFPLCGPGPPLANSLKSNNCTCQFSYSLTRVDSITKPYCTVTSVSAAQQAVRKRDNYHMKRPRATRLGRARILLPMLLATACAAVPDLGSRPMPAAASSYASARSLAGMQTDWPVEGWWKSYGDAQLDALIDEGIAGSPDLAAASARLRTAQGLAQQAGAALLPS